MQYSRGIAGMEVILHSDDTQNNLIDYDSRAQSSEDDQLIQWEMLIVHKQQNAPQCENINNLND